MKRLPFIKCLLVVLHPRDRPSVLPADALPKGDVRPPLPSGDKLVEDGKKLLKPPVQVVRRKSRGFCADLRRQCFFLEILRKSENSWRGIKPTDSNLDTSKAKRHSSLKSHP